MTRLTTAMELALAMFLCLAPVSAASVETARHQVQAPEQPQYVLDTSGHLVPLKQPTRIDLDWALGLPEAEHISTLAAICASRHYLHTDDDVSRRVRRALLLAQPWCGNLTQTMAGGGRQLLQNVIVPGNPLDRTFNGFASDFDILALLTVALNFQQDPTFAGRTNSANSARAQTFKGGRFPFGVNFAVTNTFGAKTKGTLDFNTRSNRQAAVADASSDARAIAFPAVGDVQVVQGVITSALSQTRLQQKPSPPSPPPRNKTVPRIPLDPKAIPKYVVRNVNLSQPVNKVPPPGPIANLGTTTEKFGPVNKDEVGKGPGGVGNPGADKPGLFRSASPDNASTDPVSTGPPPRTRLGQLRQSLRQGLRDSGSSDAVGAPQTSDPPSGGDHIPEAPPSYNTSAYDRYFGNLSVAGDGEGYSMYRPPDRISSRLDQLDYEYYNGWYNDHTFEEGDPAMGYKDWHFNYLDQYVYVGYDYEDHNTTAGANGTVAENGTMALRSGLNNSDPGFYVIPDPQVSELPPFKIFLATTLEYGRAGQYAYFYTNYFRFLYSYYFAPQVIPATGVTRQRSVSYVKRDERASTAGQSQSQGTGTEVAAVVNSVSAATSNAISQSLNVTDLFGSSIFTGPPNVLTRYAGAQASAVAFGRSYYYTQPAITVADASTQANANAGYAAGGAGGFTAYSSASQFSGVRGQALGVTGEVGHFALFCDRFLELTGAAPARTVNIDWDVGGKKKK